MADGALPMNNSPLASPCIGLCRIDPRNGHCEGCQRTLDEIAAWSGADDSQKRTILHRVAERRASSDWFDGDLRADCDR